MTDDVLQILRTPEELEEQDNVRLSAVCTICQRRNWRILMDFD